MRQTLVVLLFGWIAVGAGSDASQPYFRHVRDVTISAANRQNYVVVDQDLWSHARPELFDLRLYDGQSQVPYVLREERSITSNVEHAAKILNLGSAAGRTEFDLDVAPVTEYNRVRLQLDAKDFVATAQVEGRHELSRQPGTRLGKSTLYDFTRERLGSSSVLKFPSSSFRYLHVRLTAGIRPAQIKGALVSSFEEENAAWTGAGACTPAGQAPAKSTVFDCAPSEGMPADRILFEVPAERVNFRRAVAVQGDEQEFATGEIRRIQITREGQRVTSENLAVDLSGRKCKQLKVTIENGDDAPLPVQSTQLLSIQRRIYFDPAGKTSLRLYYGDEKLTAPAYDYAEFFREDAAAAVAKLGPERSNPGYKGRPDERPWSERHPAVLWLALLLAVAVLAGLAIRGFSRTASE